VNYDVVIIGAGPAGIFSALELVNSGLKIAIFEKGNPLDQRHCQVLQGKPCIRCVPCHLLCGWGGAGAFSDGKLTLSKEVGGWLSEYVDDKVLNDLINYVNLMFSRFGKIKPPNPIDMDEVEKIRKKAILADLRLIPYTVNHLGTEVAQRALRNMYDHISKSIDIFFRKPVKRILTEDKKVIGIELKNGEKVYAKYVIVAPGREGADWFKEEAKRLGIKLKLSLVDIGVRVEVPAEVMEPLTNVLYEPKFEYFTKRFDDRVRTFCVNPYGFVTLEVYSDTVLVNGQSYRDKRSNNTNFAILVSSSFTEPFKSPIEYAKHVARLANMLSGGSVIVQRLGDLIMGRRSTPERIKKSIVEPTLKLAVPGDLSFVIPYRHLSDIIEMLKAIDKVAPGVYSEHTLLYGVEAKFYTAHIDVKSNMESPYIKNLYTIGDGAGITRGLMQASISGVIAARDILLKEKIKVSREIEISKNV